MLAALRLLLAYTRSRTRCTEQTVPLPAGDGTRPADVFLPNLSRPAPGWVVLHGLTVMGRRHPSLLRLARALSSAGNVVVVPEIPEWTRLCVSTGAVADAVVAGTEFLAARSDVLPGRIGVLGFSFGATQALVAAADPRAHRVERVVGFGGYCDLERLAQFMMTGEHHWGGVRHRVDPDPYGRWVVAGNFLTGIPGLEDHTAVAAALLRLAEESGRAGLYRPDSHVDPLKAELRAQLPARQRSLWDLLAPEAGRLPAPSESARDFGRQVAAAALRAEPLLAPHGALARLCARPVLAHGYADRLVPFSETLRLRRLLPASLAPVTTVTHLFAHSIGSERLAPQRYAGEVWRLIRFFHHAVGPARR